MKKDELYEELVNIRARSKQIREEIDLLEQAENEAKYKPLIGRYFALRYEDDDREPNQFCLIKGYKEGSSLSGNIITIYGTEKKPITKDDWFSIEINHNISSNQIENGYEIEKELYDSYLEMGLSNL
jgi:hypothetical protein